MTMGPGNKGFLKLGFVINTLPDSMISHYCTVNDIDIREATMHFETRSYLRNIHDDVDPYEDEELDDYAE
jgi:hypothetical protein